MAKIEKGIDTLKPCCDVGTRLLSNSSIPSKAMAMKLVLAQSRLQHKGRVGVSCTEQNDSRKSTASQLCLREYRQRVFSVCVFESIDTMFLSLCLTESTDIVFGTLPTLAWFSNASLYFHPRQPGLLITTKLGLERWLSS